MYDKVALVLLVIVAGTALFVTRSQWTPRFLADIINGTADRVCDAYESLRARSTYTRLPTTFSGDAEAGLSSATFDLASNIESGDGRAGLDNASKAAIKRIMDKRKITFDEARRIYTEQRFKANNIGADGRPRDPKFVSFS